MIEYLNARNKEFKLRAGVDITDATYEKYERTLRFVIDFFQEELKVKNFPLVKIDGKFLEKYFQYLRTVKKIGNNTAVKYIITFKTGLMPAIQSGIIKHDPFKQMRFKTKTLHKGFLTNEEIELITNCPESNPML